MLKCAFSLLIFRSDCSGISNESDANLNDSFEGNGIINNIIQNINLDSIDQFENRKILEAKIVRLHSKKICFYGNCQTEDPKRWLCKCCQLSFCSAHSLPEIHAALTKKLVESCGASMCISDSDIFPAISAFGDSLICYPCIYHQY